MHALKIHFLVERDNFRRGTYFRYHNLAIALQKLGHDVTVFSTDTSSGAKDKEEIRDGVLYKIAAANKNCLRQYFIDYPDCDIAHLFQPMLSPALAWLRLSRKGARAVFYDWDDLWVGGLWSGNFRQHFAKCMAGKKKWHTLRMRLTTGWIEQNLPSRTDYMTTCSHFLANLAQEQKAENVSIIHNGLWSFSSLDKVAAREKLGLVQDCLYVGFMGNSYGLLPWCFEAFKQSLQKSPNLRLALCGADNPETTLQGLDAEVRERVDHLGLLSSMQVRQFAAAIDIGLLPLSNTNFHQSRFPMKFAEYLASGTPVLCSNVGECAQLSKSLPFVIEAGSNREEFAEALSHTVSLLENGALPPVDKEKVEQLFSWEIISKKLLEAYHKALAAH